MPVTWAWLMGLLSGHRRTELRLAGPQTLLPVGWDPLHLRHHCHRPVPESKGGRAWLWGEGVGPPRWMFRGALVSQSLERGYLWLGIHGPSRDQPHGHIGWAGGWAGTPVLATLVKSVDM